MDAAPQNADGSPATDPALQLAVFALRALMLAGEQFRHAVAEHFGVGLSETIAMSHLSTSGALTPRQVADKVGLTPSTVTSLLDRLEAAGLATRTAHPTDRRKSVVTITEDGLAMLMQVQQWIRAAMGALERDRLPETVAALNDLSKALEVQTAKIRSQPASDADQECAS